MSEPIANVEPDDTFTKQEVKMGERMLKRSLVLLGLTIVGLVFLELMTGLAKTGILNLGARMPQIVLFVQAATIITWMEVTLLWVRAAMTPQMDFQQIAEKACATPGGAAVVHAGMVFMWAFRAWMFLKIAGFL